MTQVVPFEMVDAAVEEARSAQCRVRDLPARVVVYLLLAAALFADVGYPLVWSKLVAGLPAGRRGSPMSSGLSKAMRRVGPAPLRELFNLLKGPAAGAARWRGLLVCALDGTSMAVPDSEGNAAAYGRQAGSHGGAGYPALRLLALVACGSRTVLGAVFGSSHVGETTWAPRLLPADTRWS